MVCNKMQVGLMVALLELRRTRLLVFLWDKMHMKIVMLLPRYTYPVFCSFKFLVGVWRSSLMSNGTFYDFLLHVPT